MKFMKKIRLSLTAPLLGILTLGSVVALADQDSDQELVTKGPDFFEILYTNELPVSRASGGNFSVSTVIGVSSPGTLSGGDFSLIPVQSPVDPPGSDLWIFR